MFGFGKRVRKVKELEKAIDDIRLNTSNNYKDEAQECLRKFESLFNEMVNEKKLNEKQTEYYSDILSKHKEDLKLFTHKDQKTSKW